MRLTFTKLVRAFISSLITYTILGAFFYWVDGIEINSDIITWNVIMVIATTIIILLYSERN